MIIGYPERLAVDHRALLDAAEAAGFDAELVAPSRLALAIDEHGERVLVDGVVRPPRVVLPRGVNRPWPLLRQILEVWEMQGVVVVPSVRAADLCADKVLTTRVLAAAGVPVLPTVAVNPGGGVSLTHLADRGALVAKPARASKAAGVERFDDVAAARAVLGSERTLVAGMVDHQVVQPLATTAGVDFRVVVAGACAVAVTERRAPAGDFVTNRPGSTVSDVEDPGHTVPEVVSVAVAAARALGLEFGGVDVIRHEGRAVVLEVNAWPGLAAHVRNEQLARSLLAVVTNRSGHP